MALYEKRLLLMVGCSDLLQQSLRFGDAGLAGVRKMTFTAVEHWIIVSLGRQPLPSLLTFAVCKNMVDANSKEKKNTVY